MVRGLLAALLAAVIGVCSSCGYDEELDAEVQKIQSSASASKTPAPKVSDNGSVTESAPASRAREAARQACLAYNEAARAVNAGTIDDAGLEWAFHEVAALALVAEDPFFEAAADALWHAAEERDRAAVEHAARVFAGECERLVPEHRLVPLN